MPTYTSGVCPLCGSARLRAIGALDPAGARLPPPPGSRVVSCAGCSLVFVDPLPHWSDGDFAVLYGDDYFAAMPSWWHEVREQREPARRFAVAARHLRSGERTVLEVGAGVYGFMARHLAARGWSATAQEPATAFHARLRGADARLRVVGTPFLDLPADERYALLFADSVFEHVANPLDYFRQAHDLLAPGGLLYLVSPNEHSLVNWLLTARNRVTGRGARMLCPYRESFHLLGYTRGALEWASRRVGLDLVYFARRHDYRWLHELHGGSGRLRYGRAALRWAMDAAGVGFNLEAALRRPR
ncbi:MAG: class I SAM-dependent methyltransferase [Deltaproteobacteria bacterium]|nr:class I SAM-dependent methyltransferase [Deltaproteobacteria bacterium]